MSTLLKVLDEYKEGKRKTHRNHYYMLSCHFHNFSFYDKGFLAAWFKP